MNPKDLNWADQSKRYVPKYTCDDTGYTHVPTGERISEDSLPYECFDLSDGPQILEGFPDYSFYAPRH